MLEAAIAVRSMLFRILCNMHATIMGCAHEKLKDKGKRPPAAMYVERKKCDGRMSRD
jgi:hypothetical protein